MAFEWKKIFIKQRGIWIIIIMVLLKVVLTLVSGFDSHDIINRNSNGYSFYINQYKGKLTEKMEKEIRAEYYAVGHAAGELEDLSRQWLEGKIDKIQYESMSKKCYERQKNSAVFHVVYNQFYYTSQAPDERYMMDGRGWSTLLNHDKPDFLLLLCLIILLTPVFCNEYESGMNALLLSSKNGKYRTCVHKLVAGIAISVGITVLFSVVEFVCIDALIGLKDGGFPLQSLEFFQNSEYRITLNQAFLAVISLRIMGSMLLAACISLVGILSRKSIVTLFAGSVLAFLPHILLKGNSLLYYLPLPSGLLTGVGYIWGTSFISTIDQHGNAVDIIQFQQISKEMLSLLMVGYAVETGLLLLYCLKKYSGRTCKLLSSGSKMRMKMLCYYLCIIVSCSCVFTGCKEQVKSGNDFTVNTLESLKYGETDTYKIYFDSAEENITAEHKQSGEIMDVIRDPLGRDTSLCAIFVHNNLCYYLSRIPQVDGIRIYVIDMNHMETRLVFNNVKENDEDFFGILSEVKNVISDSDGALKTALPVFCFFIDDDYIYYGVDSQLFQINRATEKERVVSLAVAEWRSLYYHNGDVYYIDKQYRLNIFKAGEGKTDVVDSVYTDQFTINGDRIEYNDLLDGNKTKHYDVQTQMERMSTHS